MYRASGDREKQDAVGREGGFEDDAGGGAACDWRGVRCWWAVVVTTVYIIDETGGRQVDDAAYTYTHRFIPTEYLSQAFFLSCF